MASFVNCRIGSLEKKGGTAMIHCDVNCRIGSLEKTVVRKWREASR